MQADHEAVRHSAAADLASQRCHRHTLPGRSLSFLFLFSRVGATEVTQWLRSSRISWVPICLAMLISSIPCCGIEGVPSNGKKTTPGEEPFDSFRLIDEKL